MNPQAQKIIQRLGMGLIKKLIRNTDRIPQSEKKLLKRLAIDLGDPIAATTAKEIKILEAIQKTGIIEKFKLRERKFRAGSPPEKPHALEVEDNPIAAYKRYEEDLAAYHYEKASEGDISLVAVIDYIPSKIEDFAKKSGLQINEGEVRHATQTRRFLLQYIEEENYCFLKTSDKTVKIGKASTRKCRLLKSLLYPRIGTAKTIETVLEEIQLLKDRNNRELWNEYLEKGKKEQIIRTTAKEIQRILNQKRLREKLVFHIQNRKVWIEIL